MPENMPNFEEINQTSSEESRKKSAAEKGLPEDATWDEIYKHSSEESRKKSAAEKGLPEDAT
ncbi:MAG: hypothetical protein NT114_00730, partial [Patescibacteria group bacterium]|nr:hypothetical protein [Patescibacteria group bacterium]